MDVLNISCEIACDQAGLHLCAAVDDQVFFDGDPAHAGACSIALPDDDAQHQLTFRLSGKTAEHTRINELGEIVQDTVITVKHVQFDDIELGPMFFEKSVYRHDFNGHGPATVDQFFGTMGCNGTVTMEFTTPGYLWLLENM